MTESYIIPHSFVEKTIMDMIEEEGKNLISIPGIYEILNEEWNNEIVQKWIEAKENGEV